MKSLALLCLILLAGCNDSSEPVKINTGVVVTPSGIAPDIVACAMPTNDVLHPNFWKEQGQICHSNPLDRIPVQP